MKGQGVIRWDDHTKRYEYWHTSRCVAHSSFLSDLMAEYPMATVAKNAAERNIEQNGLSK